MDKLELFEKINILFNSDIKRSYKDFTKIDLRENIKSFLVNIGWNETKRILTIYMKEHCLSGEWNIEDVALFIKWLSDYMGIDLI